VSAWSSRSHVGLQITRHPAFHRFIEEFEDPLVVLDETGRSIDRIKDVGVCTKNGVPGIQDQNYAPPAKLATDRKCNIVIAIHLANSLHLLCIAVFGK
jgi:hypothetical protein